MTIIDDLTPIYYQLNRLYVFRSGSVVTATAELSILNTNGRHIAGDNPATTLTSGEASALDAFITRELAVYKTATSLIEWTG